MSSARNFGILIAAEVAVDAVTWRVSRVLFIDSTASSAVRRGANNSLAAIPDQRIYIVSAADALGDTFSRAPQDIGVLVSVAAGADSIGGPDRAGAGEPALVVATLKVVWCCHCDCAENDGNKVVEFHDEDW